eukprot:TRINITY_DN2676_c0_g1_i7.p1 TRINITY_DN2676_c0_g1~~TRINITY_DN2676_c0_g1_i7.p1  ORF type:complete len:372 (+),score=107.44 TRINITY_DN2676_c0_g1_i7:43-1116(+)
MSVIVLGGCGFVGRYLVQALVDSEEYDLIRVVDKVPPQLLDLDEELAQVFEEDCVEFMQIPLDDPSQVAQAFALDDDNWTYAFYCAGVVRYDLPDEAILMMNKQPAVNCANAAKACNCGKFIYLSSARVYESSSRPLDERAKIAPQTIVARAHFETEEELKKMGIPLVIARSAIAYGKGEIMNIMPRLTIARLYQETGEVMKCMWTDSLCMNTVHVDDLAHALIHLAENVENGVFNICDKTNTTQNTINNYLSELFKINIEYVGAIFSRMAAGISLDAVAKTVNLKHLKEFNELMKKNNMRRSPIHPKIPAPLLGNNSLCINGNAIESTGFCYEHPIMTKEDLIDCVDYWKNLEMFP